MAGHPEGEFADCTPDTIPCSIEGCKVEGHVAPDYESEGGFISGRVIAIGEGEFHCACRNCSTDFRGFLTQSICESFWDHHFKHCARYYHGDQVEVLLEEAGGLTGENLKVQLALETSRADELDEKHRNMSTMYTASEARNQMLEKMIRSVLG